MLADLPSPPPNVVRDPRRPPSRAGVSVVEGYIGEDGELYEWSESQRTGEVRWLLIEG